MEAVSNFPVAWSSEKKVQEVLASEARRGISAGTHNQALKALVFFYRWVLQTPLAELELTRVHRPVRVKKALSRACSTMTSFEASLKASPHPLGPRFIREARSVKEAAAASLDSSRHVALAGESPASG